MNGATADRSLSSPPGQPTLTERARDLIRVVKRHWIAVAAVFLLTLVTAVGVGAAGSKQYQATAQILLQQTDAVKSAILPNSVSSAADAERDINTYVQLITVDPVANSVRNELGLHMSVPDLVSQISVSGQANSNLVSITANDPTAAGAAQLANAFAHTYQSYRRQTALAAINSAMATALENPASRVKGSPVSTRVEQLQSAAATETGGVQIIRPATVPNAPASTGLKVIVAVGLFAATILSVLTAFVLKALDTRLIDERDLEENFGVPVLATIPSLGDARKRRRRPSTTTGAITELAGLLAFRDDMADSQVIMLSPVSGREDGRTLALALAKSLASLGERVILIEADFGSSGSRTAAHVEEPGGLTAILSGRSTFEAELTQVHSAARRSRTPGAASVGSYALLSSGAAVTHPAAFLSSAAMDDVLQTARRHADIVLVLSPPLTDVTGALPLAKRSDQMIVLVQPGSVRAQRVARLKQLLADASVPLQGTILIARRANRGQVHLRQDLVLERHSAPTQASKDAGRQHVAAFDD